MIPAVHGQIRAMEHILYDMADFVHEGLVAEISGSLDLALPAGQKVCKSPCAQHSHMGRDDLVTPVEQDRDRQTNQLQVKLGDKQTGMVSHGENRVVQSIVCQETCHGVS